MPSPHPAVTPTAIIIAKKYGKSVSKGIVEMQRCIKVLEAAMPRENTIEGLRLRIEMCGVGE